MPLHRMTILIAVQVALLVAVSTLPVNAQSSVAVSSVSIQATLDHNGELEVTQTIILPSPAELRWQLFGRIRNLSVTGDGQLFTGQALRQKKNDTGTAVESTDEAVAWRVSYRTSSQLIRSKERDQLYLPILKESGAAINNLKINFLLPETATGSGLIGNLYAISGVGRSEVTTLNQRSIEAVAFAVGPKAIITLNAHWPTDVLRLSPVQEIRLALDNLEILPWLTIGLLLPLISFLALLRLLAKQRRQEIKIGATQSKPPQELSPLIVGTLVDKKIYPREMVAMLIDLCCRGYIVIVKKSGQYYLSQRKQIDQNLESWEKDILEALFPIANAKITTQALSGLNRQSLFSPKVRHAFQVMYDQVTAKKYFAENPHRTRVRYKLFALALYFSSVIGAIWVAVTGSSPYLLLPVAGTMLVCRLIISYSPGLIHYTRAGLEARSQWVAFGAYLATQEPLPIEAARNQVFEKYLGYAVALNITLQWAKRFDLSNIVIVKPDWFISYEETSTAQFASELEEFSQSISELLTEMRGPVVS